LSAARLGTSSDAASRNVEDDFQSATDTKLETSSSRSSPDRTIQQDQHLQQLLDKVKTEECAKLGSKVLLAKLIYLSATYNATL